MFHEDLTRRIIACAHGIYNSIGSGFHESVYQQGMAVEFADARIQYGCEVAIPLFHKHRKIGEFRADFVVENLVIVELKALDFLQPVHSAQLLNYLRVSRKELGLLINFSPKTIEVRRRVNTPRPLNRESA